MIMRLQKVVFAHDSNEFGGMELYLLRLIKNLNQKRYSPALLVPGYIGKNYASPEQLIQEAQALGVPILKTDKPSNKFKLHSAKELLAVTRLLKQYQADVLHIHTCRPEGARKVTLAAKLAGVQAIIRTEHMPPEVYMTSTSRIGVKPFDWMTDKIVTGSDGDRKGQIQTLGRAANKVVCSHNSVEWEQFDPCHDVRAAKDHLGLDPNLPVVGTIGRFVEQKGQIYLIQSIASVIDQFGPVNLLLIGGGELRPELQSQADHLGISQYVHFYGFQKDVRPFIYAMDIATMPSLYEVFSLSMLEFMASGKAIIASDHSSFQEGLIHGQSGLLVQRKNSEALFDALYFLLMNPEERIRLGKNALERVRTHFGFDRLANDMMNLYDSILS
jgi:glycosyltransferase involved in cell wall biosynthesis